VRRVIPLLAPAALLALALATIGCGPLGRQLTWSPSQLPGAQAGHRYSAAISVSNNSTPVFLMTISSGQLPRGLTFHYTRGKSSAEIRGVPKEAGAFPLAVSAWCLGTQVSGQTGRQTYELSVK